MARPPTAYPSYPASMGVCLGELRTLSPNCYMGARYRPPPVERGRQLSRPCDAGSRRMSRSFAAGSESGESACERASRHPGRRAGSCRRKARCQTLCSPANVGVPWRHDRQWGELGARPKHKLHRPMPAVAAESALCGSRNVRTQSRALHVAWWKLNHWCVSAIFH